MQQKPRPELLMRFCKGRLRFMVENKVLLHKLLCNNVSLHAYMCLCAQYAFEMGGDCLHRTQAAMLSFCLCGKYRDFFKPFKKHITCLIRTGFFIRRRPKNSRAQKLKLKKFFAKTQAFFRKNSRNRKMLRTFMPYITNLCCL